MASQCITSTCNSPVNVAKHGLCSACYNRARYNGEIEIKTVKTVPLAARLWSSISVGSPSECWEWTAKQRTAGYGSLYDSVTRKRVQAHRAAWESVNGPIPRGSGAHGTVVLHTCDNRLCCNPAHLRLGTQGENVKDMDAKGRRKTVNRFGERHHMTKVTEDDVRAIRKTDHKSDAIWAEKFGMSRMGIQAIRIGRTWRHVK